MAKTPSSNTVRKASGKAKSSKSALATPADRSPAVEVATRLDEDCIRERAYGIWIAEGDPTAENTRIGAAPIRSFSAKVNSATRRSRSAPAASPHSVG